MVVDLLSTALALLAGVVVGAWVFGSKCESPHGTSQSDVLQKDGAAGSFDEHAIGMIATMLVVNEELQEQLTAAEQKFDLQTLESEGPSGDLGPGAQILPAIEPAFDLSSRTSGIA